MIRPGRLWYLLQREIKGGPRAMYHRWRTFPRIAKWRWPYWGEALGPTPIHVLTGESDWLLSAWMLASWFHFTDRGWPVVIHDDGTLPAEACEALLQMFSSVRIISRAEANARMHKQLTAYPFCLDFRDAHPLALKIFDMPHFAAGDRFMIFDSDLLFFSKPQEVLAWAGAENNEECWFNEDVQEGSLVSGRESRDELGVKLWPRVNSGLCLLYKPALELDLCDRALAETSVLRGHIWRVEQTLFALCASHHGKGGLLPKTYEVSVGKRSAPGAVARHYVGAVRNRFYTEGLPRLRDVLLAPEAE